MTDYLTEQEQIEALKNWIKQYSLVILTGVLVAVIAISGWRYWQDRQNKIFSHASAIYDEMLTAYAQNNMSNTAVQAKKLYSHYPKTVYGQMAALMLARDAALRKNYPLAEKHLNWVIQHSNTATFRQIARLRLARVYIANQQYQQSLNVLETIEDQTFKGEINEVKGDAYLAMKNVAMARQAYGQALQDIPDAENVRPLLPMKYDNLTPLTQ